MAFKKRPALIHVTIKGSGGFVEGNTSSSLNAAYTPKVANFSRE